MINSFKLMAAAIVLGICAVSMSGVMAQQPGRPPVRVIQFQGDMTMILGGLASTYGVTIGLELDAQRYHVVRLSLLDPTVTDAMNAIAESSKKYQWRQTGAIVDVWPLAGGNTLLETRISSLNVKDLTPLEAIDQLLNLPEVQANMIALKLERQAPNIYPKNLSSSRFAVNLAGMTLREALNKIAQESHIDIWIFRNHPNGFFSISSLDK